jgi:hypothetical protein
LLAVLIASERSRYSSQIAGPGKLQLTILLPSQQCPWDAVVFRLGAEEDKVSGDGSLHA